MSLSVTDAERLKLALSIANYTAIREFNEIRLPYLRTSCPSMFSPIVVMNEMNTVYSKVIDSIIDEHLTSLLGGDYVRQLRVGHDFEFCGEYGENKNSFKFDDKYWTGNGFPKADLHVLSKFEVDAVTGKIVSVFCGFININERSHSKWSKKVGNASNLKIHNLDEPIFTIACGSVKRSTKYLDILLTPVVYEPYNPIHQAYLRFKAYLTANAFQ